MSTSPFGAAGFGFHAFDPAQLQRMGQQWFAAMSPPAPTPAPDPFGWWKPAAPAAAPLDPTALAGQWMGQMQQLAAQFGGQAAQPADIASAWRALVGENPFAQAAASGAFMPPAFAMPGAGASPRGPLDMPAFGYTREHQERAQAFAKTAAEFQEASQAFNTIVADTGRDAFARFESLLAARAGEGKPVESARALFDLWIDAAEDAYAEVALGEKFQQAFGNYVNSQMRLRAAMQQEVERACAQWGIPGREEVDAAHRKLAALERQVRRLREALDTRPATAAASVPPSAPAAAPKPRAAKAAPRKTGKR